MFYGQFILAKKGPLAKVWLAAHLERKLSRQMVFDTDVKSAVDEVVKPKVKLSLRTNGHLLLGIVRIYAKKAEYILHDLEKAKKIFLNFAEKERHRATPRPRKIAAQGAPVNGTIAEEDEGLEQQIDIEIPHAADYNAPYGREFNVNARPSEITLRENDFHAPPHMDMTYLDEMFDQELPMDQDGEDLEALLNERIEVMRRSRSNSVVGDNPNDAPMGMDTEMARRGSKADDEATRIAEATRLRHSNDDFQMVARDENSVEPMEVDQLLIPDEVIGGFEPELDTPVPASNIALDTLTDTQIRQALQEDRAARRRRRVRALIADDNTSLDDDAIRKHMRDIHDIVNPISLAPPNKALMNAKQYGSINHIFNNPATGIIINPDLMRLYSDHCVPKSRPITDVPTSEEVRESMGMSMEVRLEQDERAQRRSRSRASSVARSVLNEQQDFFMPPDLTLNEAAFHDNTLLDTSIMQPGNVPAAQFNNTNLSTTTAIPAAEEDRENINPLTGPPAKRSRTQEEINEEEQRTKEATAELMRQLKAKAMQTGTERINFNELVFANATTPAQIQERTPEERGQLRKNAAHNFYALLELRKNRSVRVEQAGAYQPIFVTVAPTNA